MNRSPAFHIRPPFYTFSLRDNSGAVFLKHGPAMFMPLFSTLENATAYKKNENLNCNIAELAHLQDLRGWISDPPSRAPGTDTDFQIIVDPVDAQPQNVTLFLRQDFLDAIPNE